MPAPDAAARFPSRLPYVRATDLFELATCPHRIALDRALDRALRSEPDEATRLLAERGLRWEEDYAARLGVERPEHEPGDFALGSRRTEELMSRGVPRIYQAVLLRGRFLAIPDLIERVETTGGGGTAHYVPGDVKSSLSPRADQLLQVAFAGRLLREIQGIAPREGFLVLGDGRREVFPLDALEHVLAAALERVLAIVDGAEVTTPFYDVQCGSCRWSDTCLPHLVDGGDLSLVDGMTPTRRRVLHRAGIDGIAALAAADPVRWRDGGRPAIDLETLGAQARALCSGTVRLARPIELPPRTPREVFVHVERDPLDDGAATLVAFRVESAEDGIRTEVRVTLDGAARAGAIRDLLAALPEDAPLYHFGRAALRALDLLCSAADVPPVTQVGLESRAWDLARSLRRGTAFLPVRRYTLDEIAAALDGRPLPQPRAERTPAFVYAEHLRRGSAGPWRERLDEIGRERLDTLQTVYAWMRAQPTRPPRPRPLPGV